MWTLNTRKKGWKKCCTFLHSTGRSNQVLTCLVFRFLARITGAKTYGPTQLSSFRCHSLWESETHYLSPPLRSAKRNSTQTSITHTLSLCLNLSLSDRLCISFPWKQTEKGKLWNPNSHCWGMRTWALDSPQGRRPHPSATANPQLTPSATTWSCSSSRRLPWSCLQW